MPDEFYNTFSCLASVPFDLYFAEKEDQESECKLTCYYCLAAVDQREDKDTVPLKLIVPLPLKHRFLVTLDVYK